MAMCKSLADEYCKNAFENAKKDMPRMLKKEKVIAYPKNCEHDWLLVRFQCYTDASIELTALQSFSAGCKNVSAMSSVSNIPRLNS